MPGGALGTAGGLFGPPGPVAYFGVAPHIWIGLGAGGPRNSGSQIRGWGEPWVPGAQLRFFPTFRPKEPKGLFGGKPGRFLGGTRNIGVSPKKWAPEKGPLVPGGRGAHYSGRCWWRYRKTGGEKCARPKKRGGPHDGRPFGGPTSRARGGNTPPGEKHPRGGRDRINWGKQTHTNERGEHTGEKKSRGENVTAATR